MTFAPLRLKKNEDRRLRAGHCWIYSNEIDTAVTPLQGMEPGQLVEIFNDKGKLLGTGYVNPHSLISARIVSRDHKHPVNGSLMVHRLKVALSLRERLYTQPFYRLVFGESDGLPGLVIDRFGDYLVIQITTAGMERMKSDILAAVEKVLKPAGVLFRNDTASRELEGLAPYVEDALGGWPDVLTVEEHGVRFNVPSQGGQKTGWFFDQAVNRGRMIPYIQGKRVLDVCSYIGAWGVQAAVKGATEVICVDASSSALDAVDGNAQLNGVAERVAGLQGDAFDALRELRLANERFDVVLVDPPAFIKRKKDTKQGTLAYRRLNQLALQLLNKDGMLISSSCSHHMSESSLLQEIQQAARHTDRSLQLLERGFQAPDHPVHPAIAETAYLKCFYLRVLPTF
ncbi:class I SAM-dependent rRNA methyltransferase [Sedimenticola selenatireducens]|uniref:Class I SAM-dependent rRNA methyltransferase n=1 Tax=Sedimenticola selenatireducens TaxID=191960 RepID=A0A558DT03_9GAMM|nr:class I SAM-dependent rRNA methyltransferase [Sedimenticola selenatireducens]TVO76620.1 class I SAM-dependent rRNA methyltransferase [Sedimenticola selenatireducens]TVT64063.1 MAG: class I SAM-dependent rRNA methyltransferase [Sedimenticola selenatireducens]